MRTDARMAKARSAGFTLVELMTVVGIIAMLMAVLAPSLGAARELSRVAKVHAELKIIGDALEAYALERKVYPPVRLSCDSSMRGHEYQLPVELAHTSYLPEGWDRARMVGVEDPFHAGYTYKYNAPGDLILNNAPQHNANPVWVPDTFPQAEPQVPLSDRTDGTRYSDPKRSPVAWALWSLGPDPGHEKVLSPRAPISRHTWYRGTGDRGVICHIMQSDGAGLSTKRIRSR